MRSLILICTCMMMFVAGLVSAQDYPWCSKMDDVFAEVDGGVLVLHHENATYNCCPDPFTFTVAVSNDTLYVTEREVLTYPCDCLCCYNLSATVEGLSPGEWQVVYRWLDDETWAWRDWHLSVVLGDPGLTASVAVVRSEASECLDPSGRPGDVHAFRTMLLQNTPNPFNPETTIAFEMSAQAVVSLRVFDVSGRLVRVLIDDAIVERGPHEAVWNGRDDSGLRVASGTYFYNLKAAGHNWTRRMTVLK